MKVLFIFLFVCLFWSTLSLADAPIVASSPTPAVFTPSPEPDIFTPPGWLKDALLFVYSAPVVGPVLVEVLKWLGVVATIVTALATAFFAVVRSLTTVLNLAGLVSLATKIDRVYLLIAPYLKFVSLYNAQKDEFKKKV